MTNVKITDPPDPRMKSEFDQLITNPTILRVVSEQTAQTLGVGEQRISEAVTVTTRDDPFSLTLTGPQGEVMAKISNPFALPLLRVIAETLGV